MEPIWYLNFVLIQNWIARNRAVLTSKLCNYAKLKTLNKTGLAFNSVLSNRPRLYNTSAAHLQKGKTPNEYHEYDTKQSDREFPVMREFGGMQGPLSLPLLPAVFILGFLWIFFYYLVCPCYLEFL